MQAATKALHTHVLRPLKLSFSWAVPSEAALQAITEVAKAPGLVEVGAGTGYWASLLQARGVAVWPLDRALPGEAAAPAFTTVFSGGPPALRRVQKQALLLCYPPPDNTARLCLKFYAGNTLIYVGPSTLQPKAECPHSTEVADADFFAELEKNWTQESKVLLPLSHLFCVDALFVFRRNKAHADADSGALDFGEALWTRPDDLPAQLAAQQRAGWAAFAAACAAAPLGVVSSDVRTRADGGLLACRQCALAWPKGGFSKKTWKRKDEEGYAAQCTFCAEYEKAAFSMISG